MPIDVAFTAAIIKGPEHKIGKSGKPYIWMLCRDGHGEQAQFISVMVFGRSVDALAAVGQGDKVYVEGTISLNEWTAGGEKKHGLSVSSWRAGPQRIGKHRAPPPNQPAQHGMRRYCPISKIPTVGDARWSRSGATPETRDGVDAHCSPSG